MALGTAALLAGGGALLGGIAGSFGTPESRTETESGIRLRPISDFERFLGGDIEERFRGLGRLVEGGPGQEDIQRSLQLQRGLGERLGEFAQGGFLPGEREFGIARGFAEQAFAPEQVALGQRFEEQETRVGRLAALRGRPVDDPILQAKLAQEQTRQQAVLGARQGSFATQFAQQIPLQELGFQQQQAGLAQGLATQALQNRQTILNLGRGIQQGQQQFRLATGTRFGTSRTPAQPGGFASIISGALGGAGLGAGVAGLFGGGGGGIPRGPGIGAPPAGFTPQFGGGGGGGIGGGGGFAPQQLATGQVLGQTFSRGRNVGAF